VTLGSTSAGPAAVVFFGSGAFGIPILEALASMPGTRLVGVVSVPDKPAGRGARTASPPLAERARTLGLDVLQPTRLRDPATSTAVRSLRPDAAVLADFGRLVPADLLTVPPHGFLNVHPSLLPRHRGATPIQSTILVGDPEAGVSLFEMDPGLDTGPVVAQARWPLAGDETAAELERAAALRGSELVREQLGPWLAGDRPARPQDDDDATLTRQLSREDGRLDPSAPAVDLERRVRALTPWPGTFIDIGPTRLAVLRADVSPSAPSDRPGTLVADGRGLALTTAAGRLRLLEVRPAGGRAMSAEALRNGRPALVGAPIAGRVAG
jgi:methionyl-tRNA formyltransferase